MMLVSRARVPLVRDAGGHLGRGMRAVAEPHQRIGEPPLSMHRNMPRHVVENVRLRQVVQLVLRANRDRRRELAAPQAVEEQESRHVPAHRLRLKSRQLPQPPIDLLQPRQPVVRQVQRLHAVQELRIGILFPPWLHPREEPPPGFMIHFRILVVRL